MPASPVRFRYQLGFENVCTQIVLITHASFRPPIQVMPSTRARCFCESVIFTLPFHPSRGLPPSPRTLNGPWKDQIRTSPEIRSPAHVQTFRARSSVPNIPATMRAAAN